MNNGTDFTQLWHRHLANLRDDFTTGAADGNSVRALSSEPTRSLDGRDSEATPRSTDHHGGQVSSLPVGHDWDGDMEMVVDALQELEVQSPMTATEALSPDSPWFRDSHLRRDTDETETVISSPQNSSWSRTVAPLKVQRNRLSLPLQPQPKSPIDLYTSTAIRGLDTNARGLAEKRHSQDWYRDHATLLSHSQQLYETYSAYPASPSLNTARPKPETEPPEPKTRFSSIFSPTPRGRYAELAEEVSVLILSWTTATATSAKITPQGPNEHNSSWQGINTSTESVRRCFKRLGYRVQCRPIPEDYPTAAVETILAKFLEDSVVDQVKKRLLIVYYTGGVSMIEGRMMFVNASGTSHFFWEDIREPIMSSESDVFLIFDCHRSVNLNGCTEADNQMLVEPGLGSSPSIKQLLGACVPVPLPGTETPNRAWKTAPIRTTQMTQALCSILDNVYARGDGKMSVQRLCSFMKAEMRQAGTGIEKKVFVTQLGGRRLLDIELPILSVGTTIGVGAGNSVGGDMLRGMDVLRC